MSRFLRILGPTLLTSLGGAMMASLMIGVVTLIYKGIYNILGDTYAIACASVLGLTFLFAFVASLYTFLKDPEAGVTGDYDFLSAGKKENTLETKDIEVPEKRDRSPSRRRRRRRKKRNSGGSSSMPRFD